METPNATPHRDLRAGETSIEDGIRRGFSQYFRVYISAKLCIHNMNLREIRSTFPKYIHILLLFLFKLIKVEGFLRPGYHINVDFRF